MKATQIVSEPIEENSHLIRIFFDGKSFENKDVFDTVCILTIHKNRKALLHGMLGRFNFSVLRLLKKKGVELNLEYIYFTRTKGRMNGNLAEYLYTYENLDYFRIKIDG